MTTSPLTQARKDAAMSLDDASFALRSRLPRLYISRAGIDRLEKRDPAKYDAQDLTIIAALAEAYGTTVRAINEDAADQLIDLRDLLSSSTGWSQGMSSRAA